MLLLLKMIMMIDKMRTGGCNNLVNRAECSGSDNHTADLATGSVFYIRWYISLVTSSYYAAFYHHFISLSSLYCIYKAVDGGRANWAKTEAFLQLCSFSTVGVGTYSFDDNDDNDEDVKPNSNWNEYCYYLIGPRMEKEQIKGFDKRVLYLYGTKLFHHSKKSFESFVFHESLIVCWKVLNPNEVTLFQDAGAF